MRLPAEFERLLQETRMHFEQPEGFTPVPVQRGQGWTYQHAVRSPSGNLEIRYRIDSLARIAAERAPVERGLTEFVGVATNTMHAAVAAATAFNLSGGNVHPLNPFPVESVRAEFGADWAAIVGFLIPANSPIPDYRVAWLIALHRDDRADAYILGLQREQLSEHDLLMKESMYSLGFD